MSVSGPFWEACREGRLVVQRCRGCGAFQYPPLEVCGSCQSAALDWAESSGRGTIHSATTVRRPRDAEWTVPYVVAIVRMEEGWHIVSNVVDCDPGEVTVGRPVEVIFRARGPERTLPLFRPASARPNDGTEGD